MIPASVPTVTPVPARLRRKRMMRCSIGFAAKVSRLSCFRSRRLRRPRRPAPLSESRYGSGGCSGSGRSGSRGIVGEGGEYAVRGGTRAGGTDGCMDGGPAANDRAPALPGPPPGARIVRVSSSHGAAPSFTMASRKAAASCQRSSGSFAIARSTAAASPGGTSGRTCRMGRGSSFTCFIIIAGVLLAVNGRSPASIWYATMPSE